MLPSPRWPKPLAMTPGKRRSTSAAASMMKRGMSATGTQMSCASVCPSRARPRRCVSRIFHKASAWASFAAITASPMMPSSSAAASSRSISAHDVDCGLGRRRFDQHVPGVLAGERRARAGNMLEHEPERISRDQLEPLDRGGARLEEAQQIERLRRAGDPGPGDGAGGDGRDQPQRDGGDDPERPFGADQQLVEAVAAIVLLEPGQAIVDRAVGKHCFDPGDQRAHGAEFQHLGAAGVGRGEPADGAAAARAERQRKAHPGGVRGLVQRGEDHAGLGDGEAIFRAERADAVHPPQRQQQRRAVGRRRRPGRHAGVAALRDERDAMLGGELHDLHDLLGRSRREDRRRRAVHPAAPVGDPRLDLAGVGDHAPSGQLAARPRRSAAPGASMPA